MVYGITEESIQNISKKLGEPEDFFLWRKGMLGSNKEEIGSVLKYGLLISADTKGLFSGLKEGVFEYANECEGNAHVLSWQKAFSDPFLQEYVLSGLKRFAEVAAEDMYARMNASGFFDGRVVVCPSGREGEVFLNTIAKENGRDIIFVFAGAGSRLTLFDAVLPSKNSIGRTTVIFAEEGSEVRYVHTHAYVEGFYNTIVSFSGENAKIDLLNISLCRSGVAKTEVAHYLDGEGARVDTRNISIGAGDAVVDDCHAVFHRASHTESSIRAAGVATEKSKTIYRSDISMVNEGISHIAGDQKARFLLLSREAEIDAMPSLDIARKDVSCSHSVSIGHLKKSDLYYPRLRGIAEDTAAQMIVEGMLQFELGMVQGSKHQNRLRQLLQNAVNTLVF